MWAQRSAYSPSSRDCEPHTLEPRQFTFEVNGSGGWYDMKPIELRLVRLEREREAGDTER